MKKRKHKIRWPDRNVTIIKADSQIGLFKNHDSNGQH